MTCLKKIFSFDASFVKDFFTHSLPISKKPWQSMHSCGLHKIARVLNTISKLISSAGF
eukprot:UN01300